MFRLLGPLVLAAGDDEVAPATRKQRQMLAVLLLDCNKPVSLDRLSEELWGDSPPRSAVANLRSYASTLRADLERAGVSAQRLTTVRNGYLLRVESGERDLDRCEDLASQAATAFRKRDFAEAGRLLGEALALWRGPAFADVEASPTLTARIHGIDERRLDLFEDLVEAHVRVGDARAMIMQLREHLAAHPLRERAHGQLMRVLYAQGDAAAALQAYQNAREILDAELGLDPGPDLTRLQQAILRREPIVDERPAAVVVPRQLPADITNLVGRGAELKALRMSGAGVRAVHGSGGVGKSALIIRLAHELAVDFPDGQLYVDLQGSNPRLTPLQPAQVLGRFVRALAPSVTDIPAEPAETASHFRSLAAGRRILIILDNAIDATQIRPLLPGTPSCAVLVTSRRALTALDDAEHLPLDVLGHADALALLGPAAVVEEAAARRLAEICGGLPLALRIVAARLKARPDWSIADVVSRLEDERMRLDELHVDDLEVRASIEASYRALDDRAARAFRMAGLIRVPRLSAPALAAALGVSVDIAAATGDELVQARLLEADKAGYRLHDLVRLFAAERATTQELEEERQAALHRVCVYYLGTVRRATELHYGHIAPVNEAFAGPEGTDLVTIGSAVEANTWLENEWPGVTAAAVQAGEALRTRTYPAQLIRATMHYMIRRFNLNDLRVLGELALAACDATDYSSRAPALAAFATIERRSGDIETARLRYQESIDAWRQSGDLTGLAAALNGLGLLEHAAGNLDDAMRLFRACREVLSQTGDLRMERFLLTNVSEVLAEQGRHREVIDVVRTALRSARRDPSQGFKMVAFEVLGRSYAQVGEPARALRCFGRSLRLATSIDDVYLRRNALLGRAATYLRLNRPDLTIEDAERVRGEAAETGDVYRHAASLRLLCQAFILIGPPDLAKLYRRQAELLFKRLDRPYERQVEAFLAGDDLTLPRPT